MAELDLAFALLGAITLALSLAAGVLRSRGYLPAEVVLALLFGVAASIVVP